jgi:hypothetical protein
VPEARLFAVVFLLKGNRVPVMMRENALPVFERSAAMDTNMLTQSQRVCLARQAKWPLPVFVAGFVALIVGLVLQVLVVSGVGFVGMVVAVLSMKSDMAECFSKRLSGQWRRWAAMD